MPCRLALHMGDEERPAGIDDLIDRLVAAFDAKAVPPPAPPDDLAVLEEIDREIAPLRLPADLCRFHERIDARTLRSVSYPNLSTPEFSLRTWQEHRAMPGLYPTALFGVCYASHSFVSIELDGPDDHDGGAMVYWSYGGETFDVAHLSFRDWLGGWATVAESPTSERVEPRFGSGPRLNIRSDGVPEQWARPLLAQSPHPTYGTAVPGRTGFKIPAFVFPMRLWNWPDRWRRLGGIDEERARPQGATSTIADLLDTARAAAGDVVTATIAGDATTRSGSSAGAVLRVRDSTGELIVWCPQAAMLFFDGGGGSLWELDVVVQWDDAAHRADERRRRLESSDAVDDRMSARFLDAGGLAPHMAIAGAVRPLWRYQ